MTLLKEGGNSTNTTGGYGSPSTGSTVPVVKPKPVPKPVGSNSWNVKVAPKPPHSNNNPAGASGSIGGAAQPPAREAPGPVASHISQQDWMASNPDYQHALADLNRNLSTAKTNTTAGISDYNQQLQNQIQDAETQRQQQLASMLADYSSRGMDTSTGYQTAVDQYNTQQNSQEDVIRQAIAQRIAALNQGLTDSQNQYSSGLTSAQDAAAKAYQAALAAGLI